MLTCDVFAQAKTSGHVLIQDMFREAVRRFMREEVAPQQKAFEEVGQPTREIWRALGKMVSAYKC